MMADPLNRSALRKHDLGITIFSILSEDTEHGLNHTVVNGGVKI